MEAVGWAAEDSLSVVLEVEVMIVDRWFGDIESKEKQFFCR